jgi:metabolite-proton symporter
MSAANTDYGAVSNASIRRVAFASAIGATIEWYDFFLYGVVTPLVFNKLFFPTFDPLVGTLLAYTTFLVGFVSRPVGGIVFGHYGDRLGRKNVLILTLLIMGIATFLIGLLPTYESLGLGAAVLLLLLRIFQGIGIGGEWGGAVLLAVEHSPEGKRGFYGSWPQIGVPAGLLLSSGIVSLLSLLPDAQFLSWGWRLAFLLSAILVVVGLYIRLRILETPAFARVKAAGAEAKVPFIDLLRTHPKNVLLGLGARYIEGVCFNIYGVFIIAYITNGLNLPRQTALLGVIIASAIMIVTLPLYGALSDRFGRRRLFGFGALLIGLLSFPAFWLMETKSAVLIWIAIAVPFALVYPAVYGPQAALFSELFDTRVRYSGVSFVYQFSGIFASGLTPIIATQLFAWGGKTPWLICWYILAVSIISAVCVYAMRETARRDLTADEHAGEPGPVGAADARIAP